MFSRHMSAILKIRGIILRLYPLDCFSACSRWAYRWCIVNWRSSRPFSFNPDEGVNNFTIANKNMTNAVLKPKINFWVNSPAVITRLEFINELLQNFKGWKVYIDARCHRLIEILYIRKILMVLRKRKSS